MKQLTKDIDKDNLLQNKGEISSIGAMQVRDGDYKAFDALLTKMLRTGRLLFKADKKKRKQYEVAAITKRVVAGEKPKNDPGV